MKEKKQALVPEVRFPEFSGEWEVKTLGEIADKCTARNRGKEVDRVLTNSATEGVIDQSSYFDREIATKENTDNYHIVEKDDFVYNPRISTSAPVGPISRNNLGRGIMSPLYTIFRFKSENIDFLEHYFSTSIWHKYLQNNANFGARFDRMNISTETFYSMPLLIPSLPEQKKIAECLSSLDESIKAEDDRLQSLKDHKKGLMQKLFPKEGETIPEVRFPGFSGEWEEKSLDSIFSRICNGLTYDTTETNGYMLTRIETISSGEIDFKKVGHIQEKPDEKYRLLKGDILFSHINSPSRIGIVAQYKGGIELYHGMNVLMLRPCNNYNHTFLFHLLDFPNTRLHFQNLAKRAINQASVSTQDVKGVKVPIPPTEVEQQKIADCLSSLDDEISAQQQKVDALKEHKKGLMQKMFPKVSNN